MATKDKRIDAYIEKAQPFAQPILKHIRALVHKANPKIEETIKWGMPCYDYKGVMCSMASFKEHVSFGFWKATLLKDPKGYLGERKNQGGEAMGNMGKVTSLKDLPPDSVMIDFVKQASKLNDEGIKLPVRPKAAATAELDVPGYFMNALKKNKKALATFEKFSPSNKKEYVVWVTGAKTDKTRDERLVTAVEWMSEGKIRNWKYVK